MRSPARELIRELRLLVEQEPTILASADDANFFRKLYDKRDEKREVQNVKSKTPLKSTPSDIKPLPPPLPISYPTPPKPSPPIVEPSPAKPQPAPSSSLHSLFAKIAPDLPLIDQIPSDAFAKNIATRWKTKNQIAPLTFLSLHEPPEQKALLLNIVNALDVHFGGAKLVDAESIEREKQWEFFLSSPQLKLILACDYTLWQLHALLPFYREQTASGLRTLKNVPLFLFPDLSLYLKDPNLKRSLWKALCQKLST